jgi:serine phosphatase RsbU (regulator of sigma subunit)
MAGALSRTAFRRIVLRSPLFAVPFAFFFSYLMGQGLRTFGGYYVASLVFALVITAAIEANRAWVAPRLVPPEHRRPGHPLEVASFAVAAMVGSVLAGILLHYTIARGTFGSERAIVLLLFFSVFFTVLFLGVIYAVRIQRLYVRRIREEAETKAREEQELKMAAAIQQALLPPRIRSGDSFSAAGASIPCRTIGGDFFEYFDLPGGRVGFALGDVAGKGPPAAILAALVQGIFATHVADQNGPAATLTQVNRSLCRRPVETRFATIAYLVLGPGGRLRSVTAGHNPAFWIGREGSVRRLERGGLLAGAFEDASYEEEEVELRPGDTLVLFSDGVPDAENPQGEQFGEERLGQLLSDGTSERSAEEILERVLSAVASFCEGRAPTDDVTVLVVRYGARPLPLPAPDPDPAAASRSSRSFG